jgi:nucleoside-diphosphate-sugar epimerase
MLKDLVCFFTRVRPSLDESAPAVNSGPIVLYTKAMKILVTGGSGFFGINVIRHLLAAGERDILSLDIAPFDYPEKNIIRETRGDIRDRETVAGAVKGAGIVVHAAAALPLYTKSEIYATEVEGTRNLLNAAFKAGVQRFIHISSTAVYGVPDHHPIREGDAMIGVGPYGRAKILAERECLEFRRRGLCVPILRPKSFIGPERLGVFALLYDWAMDGRGFPMIGSGKNRYQLLDVEDLCRATRLCMTGDAKAVNDTFNIGAKVFSTMKEDWQAVLDEAGFGKRIKPFPAFLAVLGLKALEFLRLSPLYTWVYQTASKDSFVSIEKAEKQIAYAPLYSNKDALLRNFRWYKDNVKRFAGQTGISHRVPWNQGILSLVKKFY